ncbi:MAG TPA: hypothetical protein PKD32_08050 [Saprospiraceae bacterium]|nr:hypothetical protein [Saprospiraceae bacterium]
MKGLAAQQAISLTNKFVYSSLTWKHQPWFGTSPNEFDSDPYNDACTCKVCPGSTFNFGVSFTDIDKVYCPDKNQELRKQFASDLRYQVNLKSDDPKLSIAGSQEIDLDCTRSARFPNPDIKDEELYWFAPNRVQLRFDQTWNSSESLMDVTLKEPVKMLPPGNQGDPKDPDRKIITYTFVREAEGPESLEYQPTLSYPQNNEWVIMKQGVGIEVTNIAKSKAPPSYQDFIVVEDVDAPIAADFFTMDDLTEKWKMAHRLIVTEDQAAQEIFKVGNSGHSSFTIDGNNEFKDTHDAFPLTYREMEEIFTEAALMNNRVGFRRIQTYMSCSKVLMTTHIDRRYNYALDRIQFRKNHL